ncbi:MAG TPA: hypothetical protein VL882_01665 [Vicinamibacterales bacterium]|nr:hypothetical protein [Vicinamibacterales bacterium]
MLPIVLALGLTSLSTPPLASTSLVMAKAGDAIVTITIDDSQFPAATALDIAVDGEINTTVLVFGKIGHPAYTALLHTLSPGRHEITALRSPFWSWPATAGVPTLTASTAPDSVAVSRAPALWLRADTVGTSTDLPLVLYAEDLRVNGTGVLRYSYIFSNEDGGTATPALLARWGRTTDIEMAYEEEWKDGRVVASRYQAPDHHVLAYAGPRQADHPSLLDATLNNVFLDRGRSGVRVTMVPLLVDLQSATRESVMDKNAWVYRRMANELAEEGKATVYGDVREYLYVDARLTLSESAVAAVARGADGTWRASDRGIKDLAVDRNGWVRIAIPNSRNATDVGFVCYPSKPGAGRCRVEISRVLSLDDGYKPGPDKGTGTLELVAGEMRSIALK